MDAEVGSRRPKRYLAGLLAAVVLAVTGCADPGRPSDTAGDPARPTTSGPLLAFTATTLDGRPFDGMSLSGKPAVLWFWAPWCPLCLQQAPGVRDAVARFADRVGIIGVAGLDKTAAMPEFVRLAKVQAMTHLASFVVVDESFGIGRLLKHYGFTADFTPTTAERTTVRITTVYTPANPMAAALNRLVLRRGFGGIVDDLLYGLRTLAEQRGSRPENRLRATAEPAGRGHAAPRK